MSRRNKATPASALCEVGGVGGGAAVRKRQLASVARRERPMRREEETEARLWAPHVSCGMCITDTTAIVANAMWVMQGERRRARAPFGPPDTGGALLERWISRERRSDGRDASGSGI